MPCAPCATTPVLASAGSPAVTGAEGCLPSVEGNGEAVDFRGAVTRSEGVVWGQVVVALRDDDTTRRIACADTDEEGARPLEATAAGRRRSPRLAPSGADRLGGPDGTALRIGQAASPSSSSAYWMASRIVLSVIRSWPPS